MFKISAAEMKEKIVGSGKISGSELEKKVKEKLEVLSGLISEEGALHIIANELGVKLVDVNKPVPLRNLSQGMRNFSVVGKVANKFEPRNFTTKDGREGRVLSFSIRDGSGFMRVAAWNNKVDDVLKLKEGDVIRITGGNVRENNSRTELHLNDYSKVEINPEGVEVDVSAAGREYKRKKLKDMEGGENVECLVTVVQAFDVNFFEKCPTCGKRVREDENGEFFCPSHEKVTPSLSYVLNLNVDDGSDSMRAVLWKEQVDKLFNKNEEEMKFYKENPNKFQELKYDLLGKIILLRGRVNVNEMMGRKEIVVNSIDLNPDPEKEIEKIKEENEEDRDAGNKTETKEEENKEGEKEELKEAAGNEEKESGSIIEEIEEVEEI